MINKIRLWWKFDGQHMHREFAQGVKNLWRWFPTIWKDRDWDGHYIYELIRVKLEHQAEYIGSRDIHTQAKRDAERMRLVARLIKLQQDETYGMEYMDYHVQDMSFVDILDKPGCSEIVFDQKSERFDEYFAKYPRQYKRVASGEINRYNREFAEKDKQLVAMEIAHENQQRCQKLIFSIMHDHIQRWWD
jgi:hypothetical protein